MYNYLFASSSRKQFEMNLMCFYSLGEFVPVFLWDIAPLTVVVRHMPVSRDNCQHFFLDLATRN